MSGSDHLFIQPWLHPDESWAGFHVDYSGSIESFGPTLSRLGSHAALESLDHRLLWFIPVISPECIAGTASFPQNQLVLLLRPAGAAQDRESRNEVEANLHLAGAKLGLVLDPRDLPPPAGPWSYLVLTTSHARTLPSHALTSLSTKTTVAITGLRSRSDFAWATSQQCALVTSEYLLNRSPPCNKPDMLRLRLLKLLSLIVEDADNRAIEEIFRQEPKLAYGLLRLVNSAAMAPCHAITSFAQAITILGRQQLQRWLQLLVYADPNDGQHPNPLLLLAATRGRLLEILAAEIPPSPELDAPEDTAFMIGSFSLLDVLLNLPISEILAQLPLTKAVHVALEERRGPLGKLLTALSAADNRDFDTASRLLTKLGIGCDTFINAQISALDWASKIRPGA